MYIYACGAAAATQFSRSLAFAARESIAAQSGKIVIDACICIFARTSYAFDWPEYWEKDLYCQSWLIFVCSRWFGEIWVN